MRRLCRWIVLHPGISFAAILVVTALLATGLPRLRIEVSAEDLMTADSPSGKLYDEARRKFGSDDLTLVMVKADDVFTKPVLEAVRRLTNEGRKLEGVRSVTSLATVANLRGTADSLDTDPLLPAVVPGDAATLADMKREALRNPLFAGNIVAKDARATAVLLHTQVPDGDVAYNQRFAAALEEILANVGRDTGLEVWQVGGPYTKVTLTEFVAQDQARLFPLALVLLLGVLFSMFRAWHAVFIPVTTGLLSITWTLGLMGLLGYPITVLTGLVPVLLVCIGFTEDVHIISEFHQAFAHRRDKEKALLETMETLAVPLLVTTTTTVLGFMTLLTADIRLLKELGIFAPAGFAFNFVLTLVVVPSMLRWWPLPKRLLETPEEEAPDRIGPWMDAIGRFNLRHRRSVIAVSLLVAALFAAAGTRLRVDNDLLSYFREDSALKMRLLDAHESLAGVTNFWVIVDGGRPDAMKDPVALRGIAALQNHLAGVPGIDKTLSMADFVRTMNREIEGGDPLKFVVPDSPELVAQYLLMLDGQDLARYVSNDYSTAAITVRHNVTSTFELNAVLEDMDAWVAANFPGGFQVRATGESILINEASDFMAVNMVSDLVGLLIAVGLVNAAMFMSLKAGFLSLIPNIVPIAVVFGVMGIAGIPLNVGTCMIGAISIGIAVDDTVHYMARYTMELNRHHDEEKAMFATMRAEGRSILSTSLALGAGFFILTFSNFVPTGHFGALSALTMLLAVITEFTMTPTLMASMRLITVWDLVDLELEGDVTQTALLAGLSGWEARKVVKLGSIEEVEAGRHVIRHGDESNRSMYLVLSGALRASIGEGGAERVLSRMGPGDLFGEVALVDAKPRSADVVTESASKILRLSSDDLERLRRRFPPTGAKLFRNLARILGARVRDLTDKAAVA